MMEGAIFDVDGTLLDSMSIWDTIGEDYLRSIGFEPRERLNETFQTMSLYQAAVYYRNEYHVTLTVDEIMSGINRMLETYYRDEVLAKPGVKEFLQKLKENGVKMCIATATDEYMVKAALKRCGISEYFSAIFTCTSVGHGKDEPEIYRAACKHLQTKKQKTVVFEDALHAVMTSVKDGFVTAAVYDEHENRKEEMKKITDCYISDYREINDFWKFAESL